MNEFDHIPKCLKLFRGKLDDDLWKKLMHLFVHGEECMAVEILCEELIANEIVLSNNEKESLKKSILLVDLIEDAYSAILQ